MDKYQAISPNTSSSGISPLPPHPECFSDDSFDSEFSSPRFTSPPSPSPPPAVKIAADKPAADILAADRQPIGEDDPTTAVQTQVDSALLNFMQQNNLLQPNNLLHTLLPSTIQPILQPKPSPPILPSILTLQHSLQSAAESPTTSSDPHEMSEDNRRLRKSCNECSKRRVRCSGTHPTCKRCVQLELECVYEVQRKRGPRKREPVSPRRRNRSTPVLSGTVPAPSIVMLSPEMVSAAWLAGQTAALAGQAPPSRATEILSTLPPLQQPIQPTNIQQPVHKAKGLTLSVPGTPPVSLMQTMMPSSATSLPTSGATLHREEYP